MATSKNNSVFDELTEIQKTLNAPKNQTNKFGGYNYRSCEDILQAVKPLLKNCYISISDDIMMIGDRFYVKATASITDGYETISTTAFAREALTKKGQDEAQITGSASSYARKYALNGLLLIDDNKDPDTRDNSKAHEEAADAKKQAILAAKIPILKRLDKSILAIKNGIAMGELQPAAEAWFELDEEEKEAVWLSHKDYPDHAPLTGEEKKVIRSEFKQYRPKG
jgi:hypothetical protein